MAIPQTSEYDDRRGLAGSRREPLIAVVAAGSIASAVNHLDDRNRWIVEIGIDVSWIGPIIARQLFHGALGGLCQRSATILRKNFADPFLRHMCRRAGLSSDRANDVQLVVTELLANAVLHGNLNDQPLETVPSQWLDRGVAIGASLTDSRLCIEIRQQAGGLAPSKPIPLFEDPLDDDDFSRSSGRGLLIVTALSDGFVISQDGTAQIVSFDLTRTLNPLTPPSA